MKAELISKYRLGFNCESVTLSLQNHGLWVHSVTCYLFKIPLISMRCGFQVNKDMYRPNQEDNNNHVVYHIGQKRINCGEPNRMLVDRWQPTNILQQ